MNDIKIASTIRKLRQGAGITQQDLAEYLRVSKAAVSKWEKGVSYPDISLLPPLATFFNVSIDQLMCYSPQLSRENTWKLCKRLSEDFSVKPFPEVIEECRSYIKKYYSCFTLIYQMAVLIVNHRIFAGDQEQQDKVLEEAKVLCDRVILESDDPMLTQEALYIKCVCYLELRLPQEVFGLLGESLPVTELPKDFLLARAFQLEDNLPKAKEVTQCGMYNHLKSLIDSTLSYVLLCEDDYEAAQAAYHRAEKLIDLYHFQNLDAYMVSSSYLVGASLYAKAKDMDNALKLLEKYAGLCDDKYFPFTFEGDSFFTAIDQWLASDQLGSSVEYDKKLITQNMIQSLDQFPAFSALQDMPQYKRILKKINNFAEG